MFGFLSGKNGPLVLWIQIDFKMNCSQKEIGFILKWKAVWSLVREISGQQSGVGVIDLLFPLITIVKKVQLWFFTFSLCVMALGEGPQWCFIDFLWMLL